MFEIVNDKKLDEIKDKTPPSKEFIESNKHNCKNCKDTVCCNKGEV